MTDTDPRLELDRMLADHQALVDETAAMRARCRQSKAAIDAYRTEHGLWSSIEEASVETDEDRQAAEEWAAQIAELAPLDAVQRAELVVAHARGVDLTGLGG